MLFRSCFGAMFMRRSFRSIAYLGIACCLLAGMYLMSSRRRRPRYEYTANNDAFKIRVQMLPETGIGFVLGADYVFASSGIQSDRWHEIMIVHKDDPDPIPRDQIHFLNGDVAYLFMRNKYAVTLNRGANWRVWDITTALPNWRAHRSMIKDIEIDSSGIGMMQLTDNGSKLRTKNFGQSWESE